ncbi:hypothetical protein [Burkholderia sp. BCC1972]|uniref:hypothetical protein n=1 Tax=Burkholderia sp. BCC1972 TaxID=2817438 RepID=UPI002ABD2337|nr:hypothetical protein [Burkholderia sp. BCC1972]
MKVGKEESRNGADSTGTAARIGFHLLRAATPDVLRRGDGPNKPVRVAGAAMPARICAGRPARITEPMWNPY